jgi:hypothetical protein
LKKSGAREGRVWATQARRTLEECDALPPEFPEFVKIWN